MTDNNRLPPPYGRLLSRDEPVSFSFDGETIEGYSGDTIASALYAAGRTTLSRSFKYHRPRGLLTHAGQDANTMVQLPGAPNALADTETLRAGLDVQAQNCNGNLQKDRGAIVGRLSRFLPVGFYYRAFFRPRGIWNWWAKFFRKQAGLGTIDTDHRDDSYDKKYLFCDLLIVGAGASGLRAAIAAADQGRDVLLVDENHCIGGSLCYERPDAEGVLAGETLSELSEKLRERSNIRVMLTTTANGWFSDNWVPLIRGKRLYKTRARDVLLCTGALEQHAVFRNNDLPGIILGSAAQRLMSLYAVRPGERAVVLAGNDDAYGVALSLHDAGVEVAAIIELRDDPGSTERVSRVREIGVPVRAGSAVFEAVADEHSHRIRAVEVRKITAVGECAAAAERLDCDLLCVSVGFMPCYQLACQAGASLHYDDASALFEIRGMPEGTRLAGACNGHWQLASALEDAVAAVAPGERADIPRGTYSPNHPWPIFPHPKGKEFVDLDEDLQIADILNAVRDGYEHVQLVKRFSTCGMGPSQGRHSALPMARLVARETGKSVAQTGVTTARPPFAAETIGHCAGRSFFPARRSNMHHRHMEAGAQWLQAGNWYRPAYYGAADKRDEAIQAEARAVRESVGLVDVSTLGGLEIRGPQAGELLNRVYTMGFAKMPVGRARYALMTNEAGVVIDDGVACRFGEEHFYVTATTGGVDRVYQSLLKWRALWRLDVDIANVTSAYAAVNLAGPKSREVLATLCPGLDLDADSFPYMGVRIADVAGISARLLRVGFVGELGFEIHVPQHCGEALWDALLEAGKEAGIRPFGVEAQRLLRLEKGHVIIGQDTDAMSTPAELGMQWAISRKKPFFVGGRTLSELDVLPAKRSLIGFTIHESGAPVPMESHLLIDGERMVGRVTSAAYSGTLGCTVGLAFANPEFASLGSEIHIRCDGGAMVTANVSAVPFYDPDNARQSL